MIQSILSIESRIADAFPHIFLPTVSGRDTRTDRSFHRRQNNYPDDVLEILSSLRETPPRSFPPVSLAPAANNSDRDFRRRRFRLRD